MDPGGFLDELKLPAVLDEIQNVPGGTALTPGVQAMSVREMLKALGG